MNGFQNIEVPDLRWISDAEEVTLLFSPLSLGRSECKLTINGSTNAILQLSSVGSLANPLRMQKLKILKLKTYSSPNVPLSAWIQENYANLQIVVLDTKLVDANVIKALSLCTNITELSIRGCGSDTGLGDMLEALSKLKALDLGPM